MAAVLPDPGVPFGKYLLLRRLAIGGMAEVWLARPIDGAGKPLVIKRILPQFASDPEFLGRFREEASLTLQLVHGNIVPVFEIGSVGEEPYIAMEHVPGWDLRAILKRSRDKGLTAPPGVAAYVGVELLRGLEYAHRKTDGQGRALHLVHRDVSPSNVVVSFEGTVKLLDFGIAKALGRAEATRTGVLRGKVGYMSPEQARGDAVGVASDLFSTGVVLYELLTARRLFDGDSEPAVLERVKTAEVPPVREKNAAVPAELDRILAKALARDAEKRWADAGSFRAALQRFLVTSELPADADATVEWLHALFPEERVTEEWDPRTATHGVATGSPGVSPVSPVALQLGGGIAGTPVAGTPVPAPAAPAWPWIAAIGTGAAAAGALAMLAAGGGGPRAAAPGALYVNSLPPGAAIRIDGADTGRVTPAEIAGLAGGPHAVELRLEDHRPWVDRVDAPAGGKDFVEAKLVPDERTLRIETDPPGAAVVLSGRGPGCNAPCSFRGLRPSETVEVVARRAGFRPATLRVRVGDQEGPVSLALEREAIAAVVRPSPEATPATATPTHEVSFRILPFGRFSVDGGKEHDGYVKDLPLTAGDHRVHVWNENGVDAVCVVSIRPADAGTVFKLDFVSGPPAGCRPRS